MPHERAGRAAKADLTSSRYVVQMRDVLMIVATSTTLLNNVHQLHGVVGPTVLHVLSAAGLR
jgi:hypothetical protein